MALGRGVGFCRMIGTTSPGGVLTGEATGEAVVIVRSSLLLPLAVTRKSITHTLASSRRKVIHVRKRRL